MKTTKRIDKGVRLVKEAFETRRFAAGEVKFSQSTFNDKHIKDIIKKVSDVTGVTEAEIINDITAEVDKFKDIADKAPVLYATIKDNVLEGEVFKLITNKDVQAEVSKTAPKFSKVTFAELVRYIKTEHEQFFPLRNFVDSKYLYEPRIIVIPSIIPEHKKFNGIKTAAATKDGDFIFYAPFMQQLLDYAHLKGIKPKGKKYASNGGKIPDEWAYIEFLIIHEFMHYTYADFHYQKILKADPQIINWVGDFRTNYLLVKSGFEQLPIGLFNDHINYDRQKSYKEMYDIVKSEFAKLNSSQQKKVQQKMDDLGDDHSDNKKALKPGQLVRTPDGKFGKIEKINTDGTAEVRDLTAEEQKAVDDKLKNSGAV